MNRLKQFLERWQSLILIFIVSIAAYGLLIPWLGYYMDDWGFAYLFDAFGLRGITGYFAENRPLWGELFKIDLLILQNKVILFHLFGLFWRIAASMSFYWLISLLWPKKKNLVLVASLLFAVYPGFLLQPMALTFGNIWKIYVFFLVSNCFTILAVQRPSRRLVYSIIAILFSLLNISILEYFLPLEVIRLAFLFLVVTETQKFLPRLAKAFRYWIPYLVCLLSITIYRAFFYKSQTHIYSLGLVDTFKDSISSGLSQLLHSMFSAIYQSVVVAWIQPFQTLIAHFGNSRTFIAVLFVVVIILVGFFILLIRNPQQKSSRIDWSPLIIGVLALLPAGIPFFVTSLQVKAVGVNSRFTMPFMVGTVLIIAFILEVIPQKWLKVTLTSLFIATAIGFHLFNTNDFRLMSEKYNDIMYQIAWRAPGLKPESLILTNEQNDSNYYTHSAVKAMFNILYPHDDPNIEYDLIFGRDLAERLSRNEQSPADTLISDLQNAGRSTDVVVFQMTSPGCVRFIEADTPFIASEIYKYGYQRLSDAQNLIATGANEIQLNLNYVGDEPAHEWCYYFEKTDLALQVKDYDSIQKYYQIVMNNSFRPKLDYEWFPFIEGLAAAGDWQSVLDISNKVIQRHPENSSYQAFICQKLSKVISEQHTPLQALNVMTQLACQ